MFIESLISFEYIESYWRVVIFIKSLYSFECIESYWRDVIIIESLIPFEFFESYRRVVMFIDSLFSFECMESYWRVVMFIESYFLSCSAVWVVIFIKTLLSFFLLNRTEESLCLLSRWYLSSLLNRTEESFFFWVFFYLSSILNLTYDYSLRIRDAVSLTHELNYVYKSRLISLVIAKFLHKR